MQVYVSKEVPTSWEPIISAFVTMSEYDVEFNRGIPVQGEVQFDVHHGLLQITYAGGSKITDAFAMFAREMSAAICCDCGQPASRKVFESPKCDNCY